jgi:hypothetical protein
METNELQIILDLRVYIIVGSYTQNSPQLKIARMSRSQVKILLVCFFNHKGIVDYEFVAQGQKVNQQCIWKCRQGYGNLFGGKDPDSGQISGFSTMIVPLQMMH